MKRVLVVGVALALAAACGAGDDQVAPTSTTSTTTTVASTTTDPATTTTSAPPTTTTTTTTLPAPICERADVIAALDAALVDTRLPAVVWTAAAGDAAFAADTADPGEWATVLGLDCGALLAPTDGSETLALVAWTGPRLAFVVRTATPPDPPPSPDALITVGFEDPRGEFVRLDNSLWVGTLTSGETLVLGHIDFNLGVTAKTFTASAPPFGEAETVIRAEEVGIALLEQVGARNVGVAQPPEFGSEEGYVMFVSPTGQILVVDVAPDGWFDPTQPRYYTGETTTLDVDGVAVRVTEPAAGEDEYTTGVEVAWACAGHVWILEPGTNGSGDEMVDFVVDLIEAVDCAADGADV